MSWCENNFEVHFNLVLIWRLFFPLKHFEAIETVINCWYKLGYIWIWVSKDQSSSNNFIVSLLVAALCSRGCKHYFSFKPLSSSLLLRRKILQLYSKCNLFCQIWLQVKIINLSLKMIPQNAYYFWLTLIIIQNVSQEVSCCPYIIFYKINYEISTDILFSLLESVLRRRLWGWRCVDRSRDLVQENSVSYRSKLQPTSTTTVKILKNIPD